MIRSMLSVAMLIFACAEANAAIRTVPILNSRTLVHAGSTKSFPLYLGGPVRIISMKVEADAPTRANVNTDISVAGVSVGTIMLPGRRPDPTFSAGGSGTEKTSSIELTSNGGTVGINQIFVTYEEEEAAAAVVVVQPPLPFRVFVPATKNLRVIEHVSANGYYGDLAVALVDMMLFHVSPADWQYELYPIKWKASELRNLAKAYGDGNRDVIAASDALVKAIDSKAEMLGKLAQTGVTWPLVTDMIAIRESLAATSGNRTRFPLPSQAGGNVPYN